MDLWGKLALEEGWWLLEHFENVQTEESKGVAQETMSKKSSIATLEREWRLVEQKATGSILDDPMKTKGAAENPVQRLDFGLGLANRNLGVG